VERGRPGIDAERGVDLSALGLVEAVDQDGVDEVKEAVEGLVEEVDSSGGVASAEFLDGPGRALTRQLVGLRPPLGR
jgi:hypothetical protein